MTSIFIVTEGHIVKVCATREIAEKVIEDIVGYDRKTFGVRRDERVDYDINEYEVADENYSFTDRWDSGER